MDAENPTAIIVCESVHHGNTRRVAEAMARVLSAEIVAPADLKDAVTLNAFDLVGFGSGIYFGRHHRSLRKLVDSLPELRTSVFLFSTAGLPWLYRLWHAGLRRKLTRKGSRIIGEFACRGWDTVGPLALVGGLNRRHPNESELSRAEDFARQLVLRIGKSGCAKPTCAEDADRPTASQLLHAGGEHEQSVVDKAQRR